MTSDDRRDNLKPQPSASSEAEGKPVHLGDRLALRPKEAADALGIGERTPRQILPERPHTRVGGAALPSVEGAA